MPPVVNSVIVLGGGSAGFMAALALKRRLPDLAVRVIRSKDIGVIGVGEGSTTDLVDFLHKDLRVADKKFFDLARPTWKLGLKFLWGPRPHFFYPFGAGLVSRTNDLPKNAGYYCDEDMEYAEPVMGLMAHNRIFEHAPGGGPALHDLASYHFENEKFVAFLEGYADAVGVQVLDDTVVAVSQDEAGVTGLALGSGRTESADLYVDASGFVSLLLGKAMGEPFISFKSSLFCDRAVVGGWDRGSGEPIKPYTTCETMDAGWCWQIEHESRVNRGYVYCSDFIADDAAEQEFRAKNPKVRATRVVRFTSGRYDRTWVRNVVAVGNASGFVEPLEASALGVIAVQSQNLADTLFDGDCHVRPSQVALFNHQQALVWENVRRFIAIHYKFNTRLDTRFWRACRADVDITSAAPIVDYYRENGPSAFWQKHLLGQSDPYGMAGYFALLVGQRVPYLRTHSPSEAEWARWDRHRQRNRERALRAMTVEQALAAVHSPRWKWPPRGT